MESVFWVALGGAAGASARYLIGLAVERALGAGAGVFPFATLAVNVLGCLAIGIYAGLAARGEVAPNEDLRLFFVVGGLGGFTTYSSFGGETYQLLRGGASGLAVLNIALQLALGLGAVWLGASVVRWLRA